MPCETTEWSTVGSSYTPSFCKVEPLLHSIRGGLCPITNPITYIGGSDRTPLITILVPLEYYSKKEHVLHFHLSTIIVFSTPRLPQQSLQMLSAASADQKNPDSVLY